MGWPGIRASLAAGGGAGGKEAGGEEAEAVEAGGKAGAEFVLRLPGAVPAAAPAAARLDAAARGEAGAGGRCGEPGGVSAACAPLGEETLLGGGAGLGGRV